MPKKKGPKSAGEDLGWIRRYGRVHTGHAWACFCHDLLLWAMLMRAPQTRQNCGGLFGHVYWRVLSGCRAFIRAIVGDRSIQLKGFLPSSWLAGYTGQHRAECPNFKLGKSWSRSVASLLSRMGGKRRLSFPVHTMGAYSTRPSGTAPRLITTSKNKTSYAVQALQVALGKLTRSWPFNRAPEYHPPIHLRASLLFSLLVRVCVCRWVGGV